LQALFSGRRHRADARSSADLHQPYLEHIPTSHHAPGTNGVLERFHHSMKCEHLCKRQVANAAELADKVKEFLATFNEVRPHETLGQRSPLEMHGEDQHLFQGLALQEPRHSALAMKR
jgi:putative transposase